MSHSISKETERERTIKALQQYALEFKGWGTRPGIAAILESGWFICLTCSKPAGKIYNNATVVEGYDDYENEIESDDVEPYCCCQEEDFVSLKSPHPLLTVDEVLGDLA